MTDDVLHDLAAVVREGLTNVARHAGASAVSVDLRYSGGELVLEIADNGRGMGDSQRRSGLANLRERADGYGGILVVSDRPVHTGRLSGDVEGGTILRWTIPLN